MQGNIIRLFGGRLIRVGKLERIQSFERSYMVVVLVGNFASQTSNINTQQRDMSSYFSLSFLASL